MCSIIAPYMPTARSDINLSRMIKTTEISAERDSGDARLRSRWKIKLTYFISLTPLRHGLGKNVKLLLAFRNNVRCVVKFTFPVALHFSKIRLKIRILFHTCVN